VAALAVDAVCGQVHTMRSIHILANSNRYPLKASNVGRGTKLNGGSMVGTGDGHHWRATR